MIDLTEMDTNENQDTAIKNIINNDFYNEHYAKVRAIASRILQAANQANEIDDCVSAIFLELMTKFQDYDDERGSISAFVTVVTRSTALNYRKSVIRKSDELIGDENLDFFAVPIEYQSVSETDFDLLVESIITKLNKAERALFTMRYLYYYTPDEIAKVLKIKRSAVDMRSTRLKAKIQKLLIKGGLSI